MFSPLQLDPQHMVEEMAAFQRKLAEGFARA